MANNVKKVWASGKAVVNAWLAIPVGIFGRSDRAMRF